MATEEKIVRINSKNKSDQRMLDDLVEQGWKVKHTNTQSQGYSFGKTCCLGFIFLPLALLGKKPDTAEYILEREIKTKSKK